MKLKKFSQAKRKERKRRRRENQIHLLPIESRKP